MTPTDRDMQAARLLLHELAAIDFKASDMRAEQHERLVAAAIAKARGDGGREMLPRVDAVEWMAGEMQIALDRAKKAEAERDALKAKGERLAEAVDDIASFGCINSARVPTGTTCGKCDPCAAAAALAAWRGGGSERLRLDELCFGRPRRGVHVRVRDVVRLQRRQ